VPSEEKEVENDATNAVDAYGSGEASGGGRESVAIGCILIRDPPVSRCRNTLDVSPTERSVLPSGDIDARLPNINWNLEGSDISKRTVVDRDPEFKTADLLQLGAVPCPDRNIKEPNSPIVIADCDTRFDAIFMRLSHA
jgi:hypothetical protein